MIKADILFIFIVLLVLMLSVYYVGASSDLLTFAKAGQQAGYFLSGRTSSGQAQKG